MFLKKGIKVKVLTGKDKGKDGEIIQIDRSRDLAKVKSLNMIKKHFVNYVGDDIYGLSPFYDSTEDGKRELAEKWTKDENGNLVFNLQTQDNIRSEAGFINYNNHQLIEFYLFQLLIKLGLN